MISQCLFQVEGSSNSPGNTKIIPEVEVLKGGESPEAVPLDIHNAAYPNTEVSRLLGILAVFVSCISSGFSGVYFERLVKRGNQTSLLIRNIQLGMSS